MSRISLRWLDDLLRMSLTGMQNDIIGVTGAVKALETRMTGAQSDIAGLETRMTGAQSDIAGLTGAVSSMGTQIAGLTGSVYTLQQNVAGLTGAVVALQAYDLGLTGRTASLETGLGLVRVDIAGLTGAVMDLQTYVTGLTGRTASLETGLGIANSDIALLKSYTGAYTVGFTPIAGIGDTNVQGAITTLKTYVDSGITGIGVTGSQGSAGATGVQGYTGVGAQGIQGSTGFQGATGPYLIQGTMHVEQVSNIVSYSVTGTVGMSYQPVTGLSTQVTITESSRILSLLSLRYRNLSVGSYDISFLLNSDGYTGPESSEYLGDTRERFKTLYHVTPTLSAGTHDIQAYWKVNDPTRQTVLMDGTLSSVVLDGALGSTGIRGTTGSQGTTGLIGITGAFGGPPGVTGARGIDGVTGIQGVTGPGVASFGEFVKILPLEDWKTTGVDPDVYGALPVLEFDSVGVEEIDMALAVPLEWDGGADMTLRVGTVIQLPLSAGDKAVMRLSYKGFNKTDNVTSLAPFYTHTITKTLPSPSQYDFIEYEFTLNKSYLVGKDYMYLLIEKMTGSPDVTRIGVCSTQLEHSVSVGAGPTGYQGVTGAAGVDGVTGPIGFTGIQGVTGVDGATGPLGVTGLTGVTGSMGATGVQGLTGLIGITGLIGLTGIQGVTGLGDTGAQGITGVIGETGVQGIVGPTGAFGGPPGETGSMGVTGLIGLTGIQGLGTTGLQGDTGLIGVTGAFGGPQGDTGAQGITGAQGYTGSQGLTGLVGVTGTSGITGIIGVTGVNGATGIQGTTGVAGIQGSTGLEGFTGLQGSTGTQGVTGLGVTGPVGAGVTGFQGDTGLSGVTGLIGFTGSVGAGSTGLQGATGLSGPTGWQGLTGPAGAGSTGLPGPTGIQGVTGAGTSVDEMRIITTAGSTVQLMAFGPSADLDNVSLVKAVSPSAPSVTITNPSTNVKYISLKSYWSSGDWGSGTSATVVFPETTGQTTLDATQRPLALRYTSSTYANGTINSTVSNSSGSVTITVSGFTASSSNALQLIW